MLRTNHLRHRQSRLATFKDVIAAKAVTVSMATKMAGSGLVFSNVREVFKAEGRDGVVALFSEKAPNGKIRVSKSDNVLDKLCSFLGTPS